RSSTLHWIGGHGPMHRYGRSITWGLAALVAIAADHSAFAQGVTGSAVTGTVTDDAGQPVEGAQVQLRNQATGLTFTAVTGSSGEYFLDNIPPGGPYTLTAKATGYQPTSEEGLQTTLGQRLTQDLTVRSLGEEIVVVGRARTVLNDQSRTGSSTTLREAKINELPLQGRNFTDLIQTAPGVTRESSGVSIAGQNNRFNNIQIDGGANNDLFGLAASGTPGGQANAKPLSIEAIQEFVVQVSPFDVRQGNFAGGLVNAITKSGTNEYHGSLFGYFQNKSLAGNRDDPTFLNYSVWQFGATVSGPLVRDKLHFFISGDFQQRQSAFGNRFHISGVDPPADQNKADFV